MGRQAVEAISSSMTLFPVLDDHNIFVTAATLFELIENHYESRKIIITTHHVGLFSILCDWLRKGEKSGKFKELPRPCILSGKSGDLSLENGKDDVLLYHLATASGAGASQQGRRCASLITLLCCGKFWRTSRRFSACGQFGYVLEQIGIDDANEVANIINTLSHKKVYYYESDRWCRTDDRCLRTS